MPAGMSNEMESFDRNSSESEYMFLDSLMHFTTFLPIFAGMIYILCAYMFFDFISAALHNDRVPGDVFVLEMVTIIVLLSMAFLLHATWATDNVIYMIPVVVLQRSLFFLLLFAIIVSILWFVVGLVVHVFVVSIDPDKLVAPLIVFVVANSIVDVQNGFLCVLTTCVDHYREKAAAHRIASASSSTYVPVIPVKCTDEEKAAFGVYCDMV